MSRNFLLAFGMLSASLLPFGARAVTRTYVSTLGNDANTASNCSSSAPCRGINAALTVTDSGGEIILLTSGGYGTTTINKSVSITAPEGVYGGISVLSGDGITIATPAIEVVLRGLTINGQGGTNGVVISSNSSLVVENCTVSNFPGGTGIDASASARLRVLDSVLIKNSTGIKISDGARALVTGTRLLDSGGDGLLVMASGASAVASAEVVRTEAVGGYAGFEAYGTSGGYATLYVKDSSTTKNTIGVAATSSGGTAKLGLNDSLIANNSSGVYATGSGAKIIASGNRVLGNATGLHQSSSSVLESPGDNSVRENTVNSSGTITSFFKQ